ncbi:MAG: metal ABC transporter permease [Clostridiales bacterium]|nr:metal ABC transporter permease [Clostridiales bacterium]
MEIFEYAFMQRAFLVGILLAMTIPCIGIVVVLRRLSMIGDALSHASLAGVALGLILGINPVAGAAAACILASLGIEAIRRKLPRYSEMSIAIMMSAGVGLAGVLSGFVKSSANFNSFLFGSIVAISDLEMYLVAGVSLAVLLMFLLLYKELFFIALDERSARLAGVPVGAVNFIFTIMTAITVAVAARTVGALIVSSMMVIPAACAMQLGKNYRQTVLYAVLLDVIFMVIGLFAAYYLDLKPGGTIVLISVILLVVILAVKKLLGLSD